MKESKGTKMARELRSRCNNMTREEREGHYSHSINIIFKNKKPIEWWNEISNLKQELREKDKEIKELLSKINQKA